MYIIKNAWKSITRNKGRNIMIMIIALVIAISACISLSIREAAITAREDTLSGLTITAQLSFDRTSVMSEMKGGGDTDGEAPDMSEDSDSFDRGNFDFESLQGSSLTVDDYMVYTELLGDDDSYYYTVTASLDATGDLLPYGEEESDDEDSDDSSEDDSTDSGRGDMPGGGMSMGSSGDFNITGYSCYNAMMDNFGSDGTYSISDGSMFDETSTAAECIISDELAMYNDLEVGDTITLANPEYESETYTLTIVGIYTNSASDAGNSAFSSTDPANEIFMNSYALDVILAASEELEDESGDAISGELTFTYVLASYENYEDFVAAAEEYGLPDNYSISSSDLSAYESSLTPLETLSTMTTWFFLIVLAIGGVILIVINIFNLRERKYEVGVLTAIGMKKSKVASQFICEVFMITFSAIIVGSIIGATVSVPVTNALLAQQIEQSTSTNEQLSENFGGMEFGGGGGADIEIGDGDSDSAETGGKGGGSIGGGGERMNAISNANNYIESVSSATNLTVILQMILVGALLTIISSMAAMITIMRYEPLQILSNRS